MATPQPQLPSNRKMTEEGKEMEHVQPITSLQIQEIEDSTAAPNARDESNETRGKNQAEPQHKSPAIETAKAETKYPEDVSKGGRDNVQVPQEEQLGERKQPHESGSLKGHPGRDLNNPMGHAQEVSMAPTNSEVLNRE
jgi:hypothetical protein